MLGDIENYQNMEKFAKEAATYYSPFTPIQSTSSELLKNAPKLN
jgi:hypothetical protein